MSAIEPPDAAPASDAAAVYPRRLAVHERGAAQAARRDMQLGIAKLVSVAVLLAAAWLAEISHLLAAAWLLLPLAFLIALFLVHDRVVRDRARCERLAAFYQRGMARLQDRWAGTGRSGSEFLDPEHPYAADLDLFGHGSLFELMC
ncbi:MAG: hypothetical protein ACRD1E_01420, partial [Terriglobales bacterium]